MDATPLPTGTVTFLFTDIEGSIKGLAHDRALVPGRCSSVSSRVGREREIPPRAGRPTWVWTPRIQRRKERDRCHSLLYPLYP
jgi:hypothetical protein